MSKVAFVLLAGASIVLLGAQHGSAAPLAIGSVIGEAGQKLTPIEQVHRRRHGHWGHWGGGALLAAPLLYGAYAYPYFPFHHQRRYHHHHRHHHHHHGHHHW